MMKRKRIILCLAFIALFINANAETRFNLRGGLSLVNNDITMIGDNFDDFDTMGDLIGKYKTILFVVGWRF